MAVMYKSMLSAVALLFATTSANARDPVERAAFVQQHPCPSTGKARGACPGWVVDHIVPLCAGGADAPRNMQWQTVNKAKTKDRQEREMCRKQRKFESRY